VCSVSEREGPVAGGAGSMLVRWNMATVRDARALRRRGDARAGQSRSISFLHLCSFLFNPRLISSFYFNRDGATGVGSGFERAEAMVWAAMGTAWNEDEIRAGYLEVWVLGSSCLCS
jgi:hypothetical protein